MNQMRSVTKQELAQVEGGFWGIFAIFAVRAAAIISSWFYDGGVTVRF
jgi:lactobin A/cerein 7B family class IIb bacteriocin